MAGWLADRFAMPLHMPQADYLYTRMLRATPPGERREDPLFYRALGLDADEIGRILNRGKSYLQRTTGLPASFERLIAGESVTLGGRDWAHPHRRRPCAGAGDALERHGQALPFGPTRYWRGSRPNVSVLEIEPHADPLGLYLASLAEIRTTVPDEVLVLPGHNLPFRGLHERAAQLALHHEHRCTQVEAACRDAALSCRELVPVLFRRPLDPHQLGFALGETLAHVNLMLRRGRLAASTGDGDVIRYRDDRAMISALRHPLPRPPPQAGEGVVRSLSRLRYRMHTSFFDAPPHRTLSALQGGEGRERWVFQVVLGQRRLPTSPCPLPPASGRRGFCFAASARCVNAIARLRGKTGEGASP